MADRFSKQERSALMSRIRSKDTKPERLVRRYLHGLGLRFRLHSKQLPGRPDIVLRRLKAVVLVQGCFWHGHRGCAHFNLPKTRSEFWQAKIEANRSRDTLNCFRLARLGWRVFTIWECQLSPKLRQDSLASLYQRLLDRSTLPAKVNSHRRAVIRKTVMFVPGMDAQTREQRINRLVKKMEGPLVDIRLLRKGLPPVPYNGQDILLADSARLYFARSPGDDLRKEALLCTGCSRPLEACVWEAQDGLCLHCWDQAA